MNRPNGIGSDRSRLAASRLERDPRPSRSRGQALAELALVLPVMLLLLMLAVDFGRLFTTYIAVNNAAREGAYYAAEHAKDNPFDLFTYNTSAKAAGLREANVQAQGGEGTLTLTDPVCQPAGGGGAIPCNAATNYSGGFGNQVTVTARQPFTFLTPLVGEIFGGSLNLDASATAPVLSPAAVTVLAPSPTPTPVPTPTPTPTPPGATPTPTPAPTPQPTPPQCEVPNFFNYYYNVNPSALDVWQNVAGFTGALNDTTEGKRIRTQSLEPGITLPCSSSMTVDDKNNTYPWP